MPTAAAIGLVAYVSADVAHHVAGHAGACLAAGGRMEVLTSVFVQCSCKGAAVDLAGPLANLLLGAAALGAARLVSHSAVSARLFWALSAGFNLLFFAGQLVVNLATKTDDWAWPLRYFHVAEPARLGLLAFGVFVYWLTVHLLGVQFAPLAAPRARATALVRCAWVSAGLIAGVTAALDHPAGAAVFYRALPQALLLPLGLWLVPARAARRAPGRAPAAPLGFSGRWVAGAVAVGIASILLLGPGIRLGRN